ncbi:hypothetical protein EON81_02020 [bacterium]|nr:MAG: hypothetical protein EON81_02020 [bacterium]
MSIQLQATVNAEGEFRLHVPELAGQVVTVVLDRAATLPRPDLWEICVGRFEPQRILTIPFLSLKSYV